jgi:hypothetical protein
MYVGRRVDQREGDAFLVDHSVALRARFALVSVGLLSVFGHQEAGTLAESKAALSQSIWSALPSRSNMVRCNSSHTPAWCHSLRRRQQVILEPHPIS